MRLPKSNWQNTLAPLKPISFTMLESNTAFANALTRVADALDRISPPAPSAADWSNAIAYRWRKQGASGYLQAVQNVVGMSLDTLQHIDVQKAKIVQNTAQFVAKLPANNVLLTGARGTGKSSLIRACLHAFAAQGLRLVEIDKDDLTDLPDLIDMLAARPERFIVYCDDLSFEDGESAYKAMKSALDGSIAGQTDNVLIYATSNRKHLMPEYHAENLAGRLTDDGEIHPGDVVEEKISLSERFGLWVSFHPFGQDDYLDIVAHWLATFKLPFDHDARFFALQWALERASRSGRVAQQFARDWAGKKATGVAPIAPAAIGERIR
jgi:predicted AAA+ superfamily ATPase